MQKNTTWATSGATAQHQFVSLKNILFGYDCSCYILFTEMVDQQEKGDGIGGTLTAIKGWHELQRVDYTFKHASLMLPLKMVSFSKSIKTPGIKIFFTSN